MVAFGTNFTVYSVRIVLIIVRPGPPAISTAVLVDTGIDPIVRFGPPAVLATVIVCIVVDPRRMFLKHAADDTAVLIEVVFSPRVCFCCSAIGTGMRDIAHAAMIIVRSCHAANGTNVVAVAVIAPTVRFCFSADEAAVFVEAIVPVVCFCRAANGTGVVSVAVIAPTVRFCFPTDGAAVFDIIIRNPPMLITAQPHVQFELLKHYAISTIGYRRVFFPLYIHPTW